MNEKTWGKKGDYILKGERKNIKNHKSEGQLKTEKQKSNREM
jgi:hypothetical protein